MGMLVIHVVLRAIKVSQRKHNGIKLDGVGPVDNKTSTNLLHNLYT